MKKIKEYKEAIATFLIGPPASGKSTWREKNQKSEIIISRDDLVDQLRKGTNMSYADTFKDSSFQAKVNIALEKLISDTIRNKYRR
jgi:predicted kinase